MYKKGMISTATSNPAKKPAAKKPAAKPVKAKKKSKGPEEHNAMMKSYKSGSY
jgi:hypothetical protein